MARTIHAHHRTERHHSGVPVQQRSANELGRLFAADDTASATETRATLAPKATAGIDALLALQGIEEDPVERRKRSVQRGKRALDVLDDLKISLLAGQVRSRNRRPAARGGLQPESSSGDPGLDSVLAEIELRVEVELAKAGQH